MNLNANPEKTHHILIVEDDEMVRKIIGEVLQDIYNLDFAENGEAALEKARSQQPDLVLLDIMMPGMDGFQVCRTLRDDPDLKHTIIVILTALSDKDSQKTGLTAGADDYVTKPFNPLDVRTKVRLLLRLRSQIGRASCRERVCVGV